MSGSLPTYPKASGCCGCFVGPTSWTGNHLRACADDCLTPACIYCRILSLACSPNGASFVCSAAAPSLTSQTDSLAPDIGSKGMNQVPGKLLLWDTKTMKQQVWGSTWWASWGCLEGTLCGGHTAHTPCGFDESLLASPLRTNNHGPFSTLLPFSLYRDSILSFGLLSPYSLTGALAHA